MTLSNSKFTDQVFQRPLGSMVDQKCQWHGKLVVSNWFSCIITTTNVFVNLCAYITKKTHCAKLPSSPNSAFHNSILDGDGLTCSPTILGLNVIGVLKTGSFF